MNVLYQIILQIAISELDIVTLPTKDNFVNLITTTYGIGSNTAGSTKLRSSPLNFAYTGYYNYTSGKLSDETTYGAFWSRTAYSSTSAYSLYFYSSNVNPQGNYYRGGGRPLRCTMK